MLPWYARQAISIIHPSLHTERGTERRDYDDPASTVAVGGCILEPEDSLDVNGATFHGYHLMAPTEIVVDYQRVPVALDTWDVIEYAGRRFQVDGDPIRVEGPLVENNYFDVHLKGWSYA